MDQRLYLPDEASEFSLKIDYEPGSVYPQRVFFAMSNLLDAIQEFDSSLVASIHPSLETQLILQEITSGSIRTKLRNVLEAIDDQALGELNWKKLLGSFLVKAKHKAMEFLDEHETIESRSQLRPLEQSIQELAERTDVLRIPTYSPIPPARLVAGLERISSSVAILAPGDQAVYMAQEEIVVIRRSFAVSQPALEELLTVREVTGTAEMILKVKKPDFLGTSMWELRHKSRTITAKLLDDGWLERFHRHEEVVLPGDSLRAIVHSALRYDEYNELVAERYEILKVLAVYHTIEPEQRPLLPEGPGEGA